MSLSKDLSTALFAQSENSIFHAAYEKEMLFYSAVRDGETDTVKTLMTPLTSEGLGVLSSNPIHNLKYHMIITVALITRFCIEGGMPTETAYTLSDLYIRKVDVLSTEASISLLHREFIMDATKRMHDLRKKKINSKIVLMTVEYLHSHIHTQIREEDVAEYVNVHKNYLSTLFRKEMGMTISTYIQKMRVEAAQNLLRFSDYTYTEISNYLCFCSHSRFCQVFKKYTDMTPKEYRSKYYRINWQE